MDTSQYIIQLTREWSQQQLNTACSSGPITPLRSYGGNWTAVVRGSIPVHIEVYQNIACILPEDNLTDQDLEYFTNFFAQSIKDSDVAVANRIQYRIWVAFPTASHRSCPIGWEPDTTIDHSVTPAGTSIQGSYVFFRRDFQFDDSWNLKPQISQTTHQTNSFTIPQASNETQPAAESKTVQSGGFGNFMPRNFQAETKVSNPPAFGAYQPQTRNFSFQSSLNNTQTPSFPSLFNNTQSSTFPSTFTSSQNFGKKGFWNK